jgi:hypothetical protein
MCGSERLIIRPPHSACESVEAVRGFASQLIRRVFATVVLGESIVGDEMDVGSGARTGECGVRPVSGEGLWSADDERAVDGGALAGVAGDRVGELDVVSEVMEVQPPALAGVGLDLNGHARSVVGGDRTQGPVVDVQPTSLRRVMIRSPTVQERYLNPEGLAGEFTALP